MTTSHIHHTERGNVLFLVLIAVALFAALSYAVTSSSRSGGGSGKEVATLAASQITQYLNGVRTGATRLILNGIDPRDLQFNSPANFTGGSYNSSKSIFSVNGGGAVYQQMPFKFFDGLTADQDVKYTAAYYINTVGSTNTGNGSGNEVIGFLDDLQQNVCMAINKALFNDSSIPVLSTALTLSGISATNMTVTTTFTGTGTGTDFPTTATRFGTAFSTTPDSGSGSTTLSATWADGKAAGCIRDGSTGNYTYFHVIYER